MKKISTVVTALLTLTLAACTTSEVTSNPAGAVLFRSRTLWVTMMWWPS